MLLKFTPESTSVWLADHYGSRRGFILTWWHWLLYRVGRYHSYQRVDWGTVERVVFVCKGNICRSAFAEAVARVDGQAAISCGVEAGTGVPAHDAAIDAAAARGFSLNEHRSTALSSMEIRPNDLLIAMEPWQAQFVQRSLGTSVACTLLGLWGPRVMPHIHDPYGADAPYFDNCFNYLENAVHEIDRKISQANRR